LIRMQPVVSHERQRRSLRICALHPRDEDNISSSAFH
jgi:hypothetical protein